MAAPQPKQRKDKTQRDMEDELDLKGPIEVDGTLVKEWIVREQDVVVDFNRYTGRLLGKHNPAYKAFIEKAVRTEASRGGWDYAEVTGAIKNTTTTGSHHASRDTPGQTVIGQGKQTIVQEDDPHITVRMVADQLGSTTRTVHINITMSNPDISVPKSSDDMLNPKLYPKGFPYHELRSAGLSPASRLFKTPKARYKEIFDHHVEKEKKKSKKEAKKNGNNYQDDDRDHYGDPGAGGAAGGSSNPPGGSGSGASGGKGGRQGGSGKSSSTNPFDVLGEGGESDKDGHPVYYGELATGSKTTTAQRISVVAGGLERSGKLYYCLNGTGSPLSQPPPVSKKDPNQSRAKRLYSLAAALYKGTAGPAPTTVQYVLPIRNDSSSQYYSSQAGAAYQSNTTSGVSRLSSRAGAVASNNAPSPASKTKPPTAPTATPKTKPATSQNPAPTPTGGGGGGGGGPSTKSAGVSTKQPSPPQPPKKVKGEKSRDVYTVHGIGRGAPYVKGLDKRDPDRRAEVQYSDSKKQFYVRGAAASERIWLKEAN